VKDFRVIIKNRQKAPEYYQQKTQERIKKILKSNLTHTKCKEMISRNLQEYCSNSPFNQLIKNFNDFMILVSGRIDSRDEVFLIVEI